MDACIGEIRLFAGNFAPYQWAFCNGQSLPVNQYQALYSIIGNTYGGDVHNFNLPDLRGRVPLCQGQGVNLTERTIGSTGGSTTATLLQSQMPPHSHGVSCRNDSTGITGDPAGAVWCKTPGNGPRPGPAMYGTDAPDTAMASSAVVPAAGGNQPHENQQPYLGLNFIISLYGYYPPRS